jgi:hypothetical protein
MSAARPPPGDAARGQTNLDFVVAAVVFLFAFSFVVAFLPGLAAPYDDQEHPLVADRASSRLADSLLAAGPEPGVLNASCTGAFFTGSGGAGCPFDPSDPLADRLGVRSTDGLNVTLRWNVSRDADPEVLCDDGGDVGPCGGGAARLAAGEAVPDEHRSVAVARRTVVVDGRPALLEVRVW